MFNVLFMRNLRYVLALSAIISFTLSACNKLEEYNPSNATAEAAWSTPEGFVTAVNAAYSEQRSWYGKEDGIFMSEAGTDLWYNRDKNTYARQLTQYDGLTGADGNPHKAAWVLLWKAINQCNAGINRIGSAGFTNVTERNKREAELRFLRAFYYWHIVETWGGVMLRTTETKSPETTAQRSSVEDFYTLIFSDLEFAAQHLPLSWGGTNGEYSRASKKSALGFLARAYLSRAYYSTGAEAQAYFAKARDVANDVIARKAELGTDLWQNYADVFAPANNKNNKEALYIVSNSTNFSLNYDDLGNRTFHVFQTPYPGKPGLVRSTIYGFESNRRLMPTLTLLNYFDEEKDSRYDASFQEVWLANTPFTWNAASATTYKKSSNVIGQSLTIGETALQITKKTIPDATQQNLKYVVYDREDMYLPDGKIRDGNNFVTLKKFMDPDRSTPDIQAGTKDVMVMRFAEMYLISAEAELQLNNKQNAANMLNVLRVRAAKKTPVDYTNDMTLIDPSVITPDFILAERARELAGEYIRWFDVKRIKNGKNGAEKFADFIKRTNPDITKVQDFHWLRPISIVELQALENAAEFGQNLGY